ncbi:MAG TPA: IS200/IS605 family transposase [Pyrinomonadaceae bacterium]|jgi:REP element-mobilizing transposase RayT
MSQSFIKLTYHIVFATKNRVPVLNKEIRSCLYEYCGGITRNLKGVLVEIGGIEDHIHALVSLSPNINLAEFVQKLKANSSRWLNKTYFSDFAWQTGYGAFTVSESQIERVRNYIRNQEIHHNKYGGFENEFESLLKAHGIDYNRDYLWK